MLIDRIPEFQTPENITSEELERSHQIIEKFGLNHFSEFAVQIDFTFEQLINFVINEERNDEDPIGDITPNVDIGLMENKETIDRVYYFSEIKDKTEEEIQYAERIMNKMNYDMTIITTNNELFSHDNVINYIVQIKRISDSLGQ
jgi:hypothetical protein